jgi:hypothetical protein
MPGTQLEVLSNSDFEKLQSVQTKNQHILQMEHNRLERKKDNIISREDNANRMILLNTSYRDRQKQYLIIIMIFIFVFAFCAVVVFVQERLRIQKTTLDILMILIVGGGLVSAWFVYSGILARDNIYFNKLKNDGPNMLQVRHMKNPVQDVSDVAPLNKDMSDKSCSGPGCCDYADLTAYNNDTSTVVGTTYTYFDASTGRCEAVTKSGSP